MPNIGDQQINKRDGRIASWDGRQWVVGKSQPMEAGMRSRMDLGMAPMVQAQQDMAATEAKGNPFAIMGPEATGETRNNAVAEMLGNVGVSAFGNDFYPFRGAAKSIGGDDYQGYEQAAKAFESQLMPIMSGAAVSPSEAQRQIRAALPELGDSPQTLQTKARQRQMMLNGAAKARGLPLPYSDVPTWGVNTTNVPAGGQGQQPQRRRYNPQTGKIE